MTPTKKVPKPAEELPDIIMAVLELEIEFDTKQFPVGKGVLTLEEFDDTLSQYTRCVTEAGTRMHRKRLRDSYMALLKKAKD